jgi:hypothetical protein
LVDHRLPLEMAPTLFAALQRLHGNQMVQRLLVHTHAPPVLGILQRMRLPDTSPSEKTPINQLATVDPGELARVLKFSPTMETRIRSRNDYESWEDFRTYVEKIRELTKPEIDALSDYFSFDAPAHSEAPPQAGSDDGASRMGQAPMPMAQDAVIPPQNQPSIANQSYQPSGAKAPAVHQQSASAPPSPTATPGVFTPQMFLDPEETLRTLRDWHAYIEDALTIIKMGPVGHPKQGCWWLHRPS